MIKSSVVSCYTPSLDVSFGNGGVAVGQAWFGIGITAWMIFMLVFLSIGGFFMFRKFLKTLPKADGKSELDRQLEIIEQTLPLWTDEGKALLNELVKPVPSPFRDAAKQTIAAKIGELALQEQASVIDHDLILRGYIQATPKRDHKAMFAYLEKKGIDYRRYLQEGGQ